MKKKPDGAGHILQWKPLVEGADEGCLPLKTYELKMRTITHDFTDGAAFVGEISLFGNKADRTTSLELAGSKKSIATYLKKFWEFNYF